MDIPKALKKTSTSIKQAITAKALIAAASLGMFIPFTKLVYWVFDTFYLSGFGVSPDIYNRPIFSSQFVNSWLVVESLGVMFVGWSIFALVIFIILTSANIKSDKKMLKAEEECTEPEQPITDAPSFKDKLLNKFWDILDSAFRSMDWPLMIWWYGVSLFLLIGLSLIWASSKGGELSTLQRDIYLKSGICFDKFSSDNIGCFKIDGIEGDNHFIISNSKSHLIYMSRECPLSKEPNHECKPSIKLTISEKVINKKYSITRDFVPNPNRNKNTEKSHKKTDST